MRSIRLKAPALLATSSFLLVGCASTEDEFAALAHSLRAVNEQTRGIPVEYFVDAQAGEGGSFSPIFGGFRSTLLCEAPELTDNIRSYTVNAPVVTEGSRTTVQVDRQEWRIDLQCDGSKSESSFTQIDIDKTLIGDGSGRALITGTIEAASYKVCDVELDLTFDAMSGEVTSGEGTICGDNVSERLSTLVVPGFSGEELIEPADQ